MRITVVPYEKKAGSLSRRVVLRVITLRENPLGAFLVPSTGGRRFCNLVGTGAEKNLR